MLTEPEAIDYLIERRLLTRADIVQNGLVVQDASRRHRNFTVRLDNGAGYFLKQSDIRQSRKTLHREAACYELLWMSAPDFASRHMPRLRAFDPAQELLVLDYIDAVQQLNPVESMDSRLHVASAAELGRALARLHAAEPDRDLSLDVPVPWILSVHRPGPELLAELSSAAILAVKIVQQTPGFGDLLFDLSHAPGQPTPIHGDIRSDNCLVRAQPDAEDVDQMFLIDWELAGFGDPCWDVAGVFCEYLNAWTRSLPVVSCLLLEDSVELAVCPLDAVQSRIGAFWHSYRQTTSEVNRSPAFLLRSIQLSAARLVQSAIECAQASAQLTRTVVHMLQLADNIIRDPQRIGARLLAV